MRAARTVIFVGLSIALAACRRSATPLPNPSGTQFDQAGFAVAIDSNWAIVGVPKSDTLDSSAGKALIYERNGTWALQATVASSVPATGAQFGWSVDVSGTRAIVGAFNDVFNGAFINGAAYIFERTGGAWAPVARLLGDTLGETGLGAAVSISGDYAVVGAPLAPPPLFTGAGVAYVYRREPGGAWVRDTTLRASDQLDFIEFGHSVSIDGSTVVIGALKGVTASTVSGAAYVFERQGAQWVQTQKLVPDDPQYHGYFGSSVSVAGPHIVVGARQDNEQGDDAGAAYVFERLPPAPWQQTSKLLDPDGALGDNAGSGVGIHGVHTVVGSWLGSLPPVNRPGKGLIYTPLAPGWEYRSGRSAVSPAYGDGFGASVGASNGCAIFGAPNRDVGPLQGVGASYIFCNLPAPTVPEANWDIICCVQIPDPAGPVIFATRLVNNGATAMVGRRAVEGVTADGRVEVVTPWSAVSLAPGDTLTERHVWRIAAAGQALRWQELRLHFSDHNGRRTFRKMPNR